jgi:N-acetylglucosamine malate deacetylase 1
MTDAYGIDVLAIGPHPDDVELFAGGVLVRLADLGYGTAVVDLTRGERASHGTPEERARETEAASAVLGLRYRENLGLPDTGLDPASPAQLASVVEVIRRRRPEIVLAPWPCPEERHPDHAAAGTLVQRAVFYAGVRKVETDPPSARFVPRQLLFYAMRHRMPPSFIVDTSAAAPRKAAAIACYASQVTRRAGAGDEDPTLISSSRALSAIEDRDRYYGSMIGASHGEALRAPNVLGVVDPVRHFRDNPFPEAHAFEPAR